MKFRFEFHGGFKDGEVVKGDTEAAEMDGGTKAYRFLTDHGRVGTRFSERRPHLPGMLKKINELLAGGSGSKGGKLARPEKLGSHFDPFQQRLSKDALRAVEDRLLTYEYEVTQREETQDEIVVQIKCIHKPESGQPRIP